MKQKRKGVNKPKYKPFYLDYNFEIKVILLFALGIFLLVEQLEIKYFIFELLKNILFYIGIIIKWSLNKFIFFMKKFELSDIVGISLILYVLYLIAERSREKMVDRFPNVNNCLKCKSKIHRIRKNWKHKVLSYVYFVNVKHYQCTQCNFQQIKLMK